jgi:ATP-binding cassette, subfamily B, bacterial
MAVSSNSAAISPLQQLISYGANYRLASNQAIAASISNKIFDIAPEVLIAAAVDVVVQKQQSFLAKLGFMDITQQLLVLTAVTIAIWVLESITQYIATRLWRNLAQNIQHEMRLAAYGHLQEMDLAFFENSNTGNLMSILNDDINQLERFLNGGANELIQLIVSVLVIGAAFFFLAPQVALFAMLPIAPIIFGSVWFQAKLAPYYSEVRDRAGLLNDRLSNNLGGITTIKSFTTEAYELEQVSMTSEAYRQSNRRAITLSAAFVPLIRILVLAGFTATLLYGGFETVNGRLSVAIYSGLVYMTQRLLWPLTRLGETLDLYQRSMASTRRVMDLLGTPKPIDNAGTKSVGQVQGEVEFQQVSFAYAGNPPLFENLSLAVPVGQTIGIVGATGSGKSTISKLLLRLYEIQGGTISIDGTDIKELHTADLRRNIGLVSQDVFLFYGTVKENIAYGMPNASFEKIQAAAKVAESHEFILALPQGYDTMVGERGQKLSGGQRQRISIARAVLKDPPILVLDEATSAVDNETEAAIQKSLATITQNRTTISIAHRLSTIRHAHCIYVMDRGRVVENGTHEDLLAINKIYASLWQVQLGLSKNATTKES